MKQSLIKPSNVVAEKIPSITKGICQRCGGIIKSTDIDEYYRLYCQDCQSFGKVIEGQIIWRYERLIQSVNHVLTMRLILSQEQEQASLFLREAINSHREGYLHAVCGAGKTEILYQSILYCLNQNYRICFAIPRTDVVKELYMRLIDIFPNTTIKPLYLSQHDDEGAQLLITTVHQLINYYQEFHLLILDEADAFPYKGNQMLNRLVKRAIKPEGSFVMMSATFRPKQIVSIIKNNKPYYRLPARYHRHVLDQFKVIYIPTISTDNDPIIFPEVIREWVINCLKNQRYVMLFVPTISLGFSLYKHLKKSNIKVLNVSSQSENRHQIIQQFKTGYINVLVTTTLLERGVTIKGVDVGVIKANHQVFDRDTLVQIAGRVGRHYEQPSGEIILFAERNTIEIKAAKEYVKKMNKEAISRGLIDHDL